MGTIVRVACSPLSVVMLFGQTKTFSQKIHVILHDKIRYVPGYLIDSRGITKMCDLFDVDRILASIH